MLLRGFAEYGNVRLPNGGLMNASEKRLEAKYPEIHHSHATHELWPDTSTAIVHDVAIIWG